MPGWFIGNIFVVMQIFYGYIIIETIWWEGKKLAAQCVLEHDLIIPLKAP